MPRLLILVSTLLLSQAFAGARQREDTEWMTAYWYHVNDTKLPRILLIGDSIVRGYEKPVQEVLAGTANVSFFSTSKCVSDPSYLKELAYVLDEYPYAVIHFNNGLHSLNTDPAEWEAGLRAALKLIRQKGGAAKVVWASSTPLKDPKLTVEVVKLNAIAMRVMKENNIPVDDLFALMDPKDRSTYWVDTYHYNDEATKMQAEKVAESIRAAMGLGNPTAP